jgi:hypothetical protein
VSFFAVTGEWRQPNQLTKNRDPHRLKLHSVALGMLEARRRARAEADADGDPVRIARIMGSGALLGVGVSGAPFREGDRHLH